jgi:hypothetical protein
MKGSIPGNFPSIKIIPITAAEIKSIINSLKQTKNSPDYLKNNKS